MRCLSSRSLATHIAAQALSNSLYALALLRAPPPPAWSSAWAAAFAAVVLRADAQHIANGLWATAALGLRAEGRVLEAALRAAALKAPAFTVQVSQRDARAVWFLDGRRVWWAAGARLVRTTQQPCCTCALRLAGPFSCASPAAAPACALVSHASRDGT